MCCEADQLLPDGIRLHPALLAGQENTQVGSCKVTGQRGITCAKVLRAHDEDEKLDVNRATSVE